MSLRDLSDQELLELYEWRETLTKRERDVVVNSFSTKFAYHVIRLALEAEQLLATGDMDIQRDREMYKSIRKGEWKLEEIEDWFTNKEAHLNKLYEQSSLPHSPDWQQLQQILFDCLETHYGRIDLVSKQVKPIESLIADLESVIKQYR